MKYKKKITACSLAALLLLVPVSACSSQRTETPEISVTPSFSAQELQPVGLGNGLELTALSAASGQYPEDGSDTPSDNLLCAMFTNNNADKTLQYAKISMILNGEEYTFDLTTVPPGKAVHAFALDMKQAPESIGSVSATADPLVFFPEEPSTEPDRLQVVFGEGTITVRNISEENIDSDIYIYFKSVADGVYLGGITYRVCVGTLSAGQEVTGHSSHAKSNSELMFVTYGR